MNDKSHVCMEQCYYCGQEKGVLLDTRLKETLPKAGGVFNNVPCDKCQEWMKQGVILISVKDGEEGENPYRTGGFCVVKEDALLEVAATLGAVEAMERVVKNRVGFIHDSVWQALGLPMDNVVTAKIPKEG